MVPRSSSSREEGGCTPPIRCSASPPLLLLAAAAAAAAGLFAGGGAMATAGCVVEAASSTHTGAREQHRRYHHHNNHHRRKDAATAWVATPPGGGFVSPRSGVRKATNTLNPDRSASSSRLAAVNPRQQQQGVLAGRLSRHLKHGAGATGAAGATSGGSQSGGGDVDGDGGGGGGGGVSLGAATTTTEATAGVEAHGGVATSEMEDSGDPADDIHPEAAAIAGAALLESAAGGSSDGVYTNNTLIPAGDHPQQLVSDILDIVGNSMTAADIEMPVDAAGAAIPLSDHPGSGSSSISTASDDDADGTSDADTAVIGDAETSSSALEFVAGTEDKAEAVYGDKSSNLGMVTELVAFTLPLLVVWLSNPIMSLVDTAVVGAQSSVELAALGPGTSVCDNLAYMCGFLAQVTTNLGASALASGDSLKADRATRTGIFVGLGAGVVASAALLRYGRMLLQLFLGGNPAVSSVLPHSCSYVYIRAMGFVAVTVSMVLQSAYLARKDIATPIKSVAGASVANLVLDCVAVFGLGMGIKGAALATTVAQWVGLVYLVKEFWPDLQKSGQVSFFPYRKELKTFLQLGAPTCLALSGQVATCVAVTIAASGCDTVALAAHQILYGVFLLFCPIGEAVSQTVQTYLPGYTVKRPPRRDGRPRRTLTFGKSAVRMIKVISAVSLGIGAVNTVLGYVLTAGLPWIFTPDRAVWAAVRNISPLCGLSLGLYGITMAFQGAMMATREVYPTAAIYTVCSVLFSGNFVLMRRSPSLKLASVWAAFVVYQVTRCVLFAGTVGWSHRVSFRENFFSSSSDDDDWGSGSSSENAPEIADNASASGGVRMATAAPKAATVVQENAADVLLSEAASSSSTFGSGLKPLLVFSRLAAGLASRRKLVAPTLPTLFGGVASLFRRKRD